MRFFWMIVVFTLYCATNFLVWRITRSFHLLIIQIVIYFYCIHAFIITLLYFNGYEGMMYNLVLSFPYYVENNVIFYQAFAYSCIFSILYLATIIAVYKQIPLAKNRVLDSFRFKGSKFLFIVMVSLLIGLYAWKDTLWLSITTLQPSYLFYKSFGNLGSLFPIFSQVLQLSSMGTFLILFAFIKKQELNAGIKIARSNTKKIQASVVFLCLLVIFVAAISFGDKAILTSGILFAFFVTDFSYKKILKILPLFIFAIVLVNVISIVRHVPDTYNPIKLFMRSAAMLLEHGESNSALSLYSIIKMDKPLLLGYSFEVLLRNLVPRFVAEMKIPDAYEIYAANMGLWSTGLGWGISYIADWYMNFGIAGIITGAIALGFFHGILYRKSLDSVAWRFIFAATISVFPIFIRSGININGTIYAILLSMVLYKTLTPLKHVQGVSKV